MSHQRNRTPITGLMVAGFASAVLASTVLWSPFGSGYGIVLDRLLPLDARDATRAIAQPGESGPPGRHWIAGLVLITVATCSRAATGGGIFTAAAGAVRLRRRSEPLRRGDYPAKRIVVSAKRGAIVRSRSNPGLSPVIAPVLRHSCFAATRRLRRRPGRSRVIDQDWADLGKRV